MTCIDSKSPSYRTQLSENRSQYGLDKLDDAFLFAITIVTVIMAIIQAYQTSQGQLTLIDLFYIIPFLLLGVILPFYVGFIRGAIKNSKIERLRGWTYLMVGVTAYCALMTSKIPNGFLLFVPLLLLPLISVQYLEKWFKDRFGFEETIQNMLSFCGTVVSSFIIAYVSVFVFSLFLQQIEYSTVILQIFMLFLFLSVAMISEKISYDIQNITLTPKFQKSVNEMIKKNRPKKFRFLASMMVFLNLLIGMETVLVLKNKYYIIFTIIPLIVGSVMLAGQNPILNNPIIIIIGNILVGVALFFGSAAVYFFIRTEQINFNSIEDFAHFENY